jgi:hypothetical protein
VGTATAAAGELSFQELWAIARFDLRLSEEEYLEMPPIALDALLARAAIADRKALFPGAMVCATLCNLKNDWDKNPDGWQPADFLPGAVREEDDLEAFARELEQGKLQRPDVEVVEQFKRNLQAQFRMQRETDQGKTRPVSQS